MVQKLSVGVIGGGYAGMSAAVDLVRRGIQVTVFESASQLGGRARGVNYQATQIDNGQHVLLGCYHQTLDMIRCVGGDIERDFIRLPLQLDLHGEFSLRAPRLPAPFHVLAGLLTCTGLSLSERLRAARFMFSMRRAHFHIADDIPVTNLLALHGQDGALTQKLWEPLCIAALNTPIRKASAQVMLNVLRDALNGTGQDSDIMLPRVDFSALFPIRAAEFLNRRTGAVQLGVAVERIVPARDGIEVITSLGTKMFSHVICAASPVPAARLLRPLKQLADTVTQIDSLEHQPIYTVYVQYPKSVGLPLPMIGLHNRYSQWLFDRGMISGAPGLIASVISAEGMHQELPQTELAQRVITELREEFGIPDLPLWFKVIAEKRATFCCSPGLQRPSQETPLPRLLLAGDYTQGDYPATLEGAVRSGLKCAQLVDGPNEH